ncbi:MAG: hypothetical protein CMQ16_08275 [Gammaproteobacteria bacterium]|nr:hypothetical protein [Gammaproteobacteria bacterium]
MPEQLNDLVENVRELSGWVRVLFVIFFIVVLHLIIGPLIVLLALAQSLFLVFTAKANENLSGFGALLATYAAQILNFVTFHSERRPFPFSDFPDGRVDSAEVAGVDAEPSKSMSAGFLQKELKAEAEKPAREVLKKAASKRKAVRKKKASSKVAKKVQ